MAASTEISNPASDRRRRPLVSVAPMIDVTDRHFRMLIRCISPSPTLWTEMTWDRAILYNHPGEREHQEGQKNVRVRTVGSIIGFSDAEHPIVLQLGGSNPESLARAARHGAAHGYDEINLNCGCPAQRRGRSKVTYGARMMFEPALVARCCAAMRAALDEAGYAHVDVTVKCRLGVDERDSYDELHDFISQSAAVGVSHFIVHARKAILGLDTIKNRSVPPLRHEWVLRLVADFPSLRFSLNGGIRCLEEAQALLERGVYGVMIGRRANAEPYMFARSGLLYGGEAGPTRREVLDRYLAYCAVAQPANYDETTAEGCTRALLAPLTGLLHNTRFGPRWRQALNKCQLERVRSGELDVGVLVGEALAECALTAPAAADVMDARPSLEPLPIPPAQPPPAPWPPQPPPQQQQQQPAADAEQQQPPPHGAAAVQLSLEPTSGASLECSITFAPTAAHPPAAARDLRWPNHKPQEKKSKKRGGGAAAASAAALPEVAADAAEDDACLNECPGWKASDADAGIDFELLDEDEETPPAGAGRSGVEVLPALLPEQCASDAPPAMREIVTSAFAVALAAGTFGHVARRAWRRGGLLPFAVVGAAAAIVACTALRLRK